MRPVGSESEFTKFGLWIRDINPNTKEYNGLSSDECTVTNLDYIVENFKTRQVLSDILTMLKATKSMPTSPEVVEVLIAYLHVFTNPVFIEAAVESLIVHKANDDRIGPALEICYAECDDAFVAAALSEALGKNK